MVETNMLSSSGYVDETSVVWVAVAVANIEFFPCKWNISHITTNSNAVLQSKYVYCMIHHALTRFTVLLSDILLFIVYWSYWWKM